MIRCDSETEEPPVIENETTDEKEKRLKNAREGKIMYSKSRMKMTTRKHGAAVGKRKHVLRAAQLGYLPAQVRVAYVVRVYVVPTCTWKHTRTTVPQVCVVPHVYADLSACCCFLNSSYLECSKILTLLKLREQPVRHHLHSSDPQVEVATASSDHKYYTKESQLHWLKVAAERGDASSQYKLAVSLGHFNSTRQNPNFAEKPFLGGVGGWR